MRPTIRLGKMFGIDVGLHWSILLIAFVLISALSGTVLPSFAPGLAGAAYLLAAVSTAALFMGSIVAHELGHSIVAQRNGIEVRGITLFALGGVAALESEPEDPGAAARIAIAGPAVSVAIGVGALAGAAMLGALGAGGLVVAAFTWLGIINLALAVFNMIPALPLDGGRVLQAALWKRSGQQHHATISAAKVGRWLGWAIVAFGLWQFFQTGAGLWTALIGWFVLTSAKAEGTRARFELRRQQLQSQLQQGRFPHMFSSLFDNDASPGRQAWNGFEAPSSRDEAIDVTGRPVSDDPTGRPVEKAG
jgi:Zn-dependent protease